ncbi:MAG: hypothetical protein AB3N23_22440 [Paracoccaceae bacterium]
MKKRGLETANRRAVIGLAIGILALTGPVAADEFRGKRGTRVNPVNAAVFEVVARSSTRGPDFWCGAADYARRALGRGWTDRIYVARSMGPSVTTNRRSAVHFTLDPGAAGISPAKPSLSINAFRVGDSMSIQQANTHCNIPLRGV